MADIMLYTHLSVSVCLSVCMSVCVCVCVCVCRVRRTQFINAKYRDLRFFDWHPLRADQLALNQVHTQPTLLYTTVHTVQYSTVLCTDVFVYSLSTGVERPAYIISCVCVCVC